eukprot:SAG31_NODE_4798_length_2952_cov_2.577638_2_plen_239_part_00
MHVGWNPEAAIETPEPAAGAGARAGSTGAEPRTHKDRAGELELYIIQPRLTATSEPVTPAVSELWYGTASPMAAMRPADTLSCWGVHDQLQPVATLALTAYPEVVTDPTWLTRAVGLRATLNDQQEAGFRQWVSLQLWRIRGKIAGVSTGGAGGNASHPLPLGMLCDLDRFSNRNAVVRRNTFRNSGHPQCGSRVKSSGAIIEDNRWENSVNLNLEGVELYNHTRSSLASLCLCLLSS